MEDIILSQSEYEALVEEIHRLQARISQLTALRDDLLYHICPALRAEYEEKIASLEREILAAEMYLRENQRILEILQAQMNRQKEPSFEEAQKEAQEEFREYEEDLKKKAKEAEDFRNHWERDTQWSEHDRREKEEKKASEENSRSGGEESAKGEDDSGEDNRSGESGSSKDGNDDTSHSGEDDYRDEFEDDEGERDTATGTSAKKDSPSRKLKRLYREIVKRLHPDANPNTTLREKELLNLAQEAMKKGDLEMMERIWEEISGMDAPEDKFEDTAEGIAKLRELVEKLRERMSHLEAEIREIRSGYPYTMKAFLDDETAVENRRSELQSKLKNLREANEKLVTFIQQLRQQMGM